jgi:hypothetical protein
MADPPKNLTDRLRALLEPKKPGAAIRDLPSVESPPMPGFKFGLGARVLDLTTGDRATVRAAYYGAALSARVYEVQTDAGPIVARTEAELERDRPVTPAPPAPPK